MITTQHDRYNRTKKPDHRTFIKLNRNSNSKGMNFKIFIKKINIKYYRKTGGNKLSKYTICMYTENKILNSKKKVLYINHKTK